MTTPRFPDNPLTRLMEQVAADNASGAYGGGGVSSSVPLPTVRSSDLGSIIEDAPMSAEEKAELDRLALEAGVRDVRIETPILAEGEYPSMDDALAAGAPVIRPPSQVVGVEPSRMTAREFIARRPRLDLGATLGVQSSYMPVLPNFMNVERIDLVSNTVNVDGMEFNITEEDAAKFRRFVVETARTAIMQRLEEAMNAFASPRTAEVTDEGTTTEGEGETPALQPDDTGSGEESPQ